MHTQSASRAKWQQHLRDLKARVANPDGILDRAELEVLLEELVLVDEELATQNAELQDTRDALYRERVRYEELFELAPDAYLLTDGNGLVVEANRAAAVLLGLERKFLLGKPLQVFVPERGRSEFRGRVRELESATLPSEWRLRLVSRDCRPIEAAASVAAIRTRDQKFMGLRWSIRDITERAQQEGRLRDLNAELERRVNERTEALEAANRVQEDLLQRERAAREAAEAANRSKDEFLATLSHELRTPLNVVVGLAFRLQSGSLPASQQEKAIKTIDRNASELSRLVEDLLDAARITNGRLKLDLRVEELAPIVRSAIESVETTAEARAVQVTPNLQSGVCVRCDPERLRQVNRNLLTNALKFTPEGGSIGVTLRAEERYASIEVRDTGVGIEPAVLPHIFERFWQGEQSTTRSGGGLGLGLAIVKHLVEMHGGNITARSEGRGRGATFTVTLPLVEAALASRCVS
jgi:PAS domain S-box-containing protein